MRPVATVINALVAFALLTLAATAAQAQSTSRLPWPAAQRAYVTQDCNDTCCGDHVGFNGYSWDFAAQTPLDVLAPRAGTVVHLKMSSNHGGDDASEVDSANYLVIDHGDGTYSVMLHLAFNSLDPAVRCGAFVRAGQRLARTGSTGWSSGNHLHYQVNRIPSYMPQACECGADGMACAQDEAHWDLFWSRNSATATVPVQFDEWHAASACGDRHDDNQLTSRNADAHEEVAVVDINAPGRFRALRGEWQTVEDTARGAWRQAASSADASAEVSLARAVNRPGVYEVWSALPARGRSVGASSVRAQLVARGERRDSLAAQNVPGGAYRPLPGRVKLTGREGEALVLSTDGRPAEALAVDGLVLRRVADAGATADGGACSSSTECAGDLVCSGGQCRAGCETLGCGAGSVCDVTGLCVARSPAPAEQSGSAAVASTTSAQPASVSSASTAGTTGATATPTRATAATATPRGARTQAPSVGVPSPSAQSTSAGAASATRASAQDGTGGGPSPPVVRAGVAPGGSTKPGGSKHSAWFVLLGAATVGMIRLARRRRS